MPPTLTPSHSALKLAPRADTLVRANIPAGALKGFDYRTRPSTPKRETAYLLSRAVICCVVAAILLPILRMASGLSAGLLWTGYALSLVIMTGVILGLVSFAIRAKIERAITLALMPPAIWFGLNLLAITGSCRGIAVASFLASAVAAVFAIHQIGRHHAAWLGASPQLSMSRREEAERLWQRLSLWALGLGIGFALVFSALLFAITGTGWAPGRTITLAVLGAASFVGVAAFIKWRYGSSSPLALTLAAIRNFLTYDYERIKAPGVFESPAGGQRLRLTLAALSLVWLATTTTVICGYYPLALLVDVNPWLETFAAAGKNSITTRVMEQTGFGFSAPDGARLKVQGEFLAFVQSSPEAWLALLFDGIGRQSAVFGIILWVMASILVPMGLFTLIATFALGWPLTVYQAKLKALEDERSDWSGYVDRLGELAARGDEHAQNHVYLGTQALMDYPVFLHTGLLENHAQVLGASGGGKTSVGLSPLITQLIRRGTEPIVVLDLKGDMSLFHTARIEAGERFRFFTNSPGRATYTFNPFPNLGEADLVPRQQASLLQVAMSLYHGMDYGRSYFSRIARDALQKLFERYPDISSFKECRDMLGTVLSSAEQERAFELIAVVESLAAFEQLGNNEAQTGSVAALSSPASISMREVIEEKQVVYFHLGSFGEPSSVPELAKLALYCLLTAGYVRTQNGEPPRRTWLVIDEFQTLVDENMKTVFQQARGLGVSLIVAHQTNADLRQGRVNLETTVSENTAMRQIFSFDSIEEVERATRMSGLTHVETAVLETSKYSGDESADDVELPLGRDGRIMSRIAENDLTTLTADQMQSLVLFKRNSGLTQFDALSFPLKGHFHISKAEHERRSALPWPSSLPGTNQRETALGSSKLQKLGADEDDSEGKPLEASSRNSPYGEVLSAWFEEIDAKA